ncbi:MAG: hypothetical protein ACLFSC_10890 [Wenzhouxiangella sp.]
MLTAILLFSSRADAANALFTFEANLTNSITVVGHVIVDTTSAEYAPGGTVTFSNGGIKAYRFEATGGNISELIDSRDIPNPTPQGLTFTFSATSFPAIDSWDMSLSNQATPLFQFITVQSGPATGFEQWAGDALSGTSFPSDGAWVFGGVLPLRPRYAFSASLSNGVNVAGEVILNGKDVNFAPGGTVTYSGDSILTYRFEASNGTDSELINSNLISEPAPQGLTMTFLASGFPEVLTWDMSLSNQSAPLYQFITVQSGPGTGFEQWAGDDLSAISFPSSGRWVYDTIFYDRFESSNNAH